MPKLYKRTARQDIFLHGRRTSAENKQGFKIDRSKPCEDKGDSLLVSKGQEYYTWHPKGLPWQYSVTKPDLTKPKSEWEERYEDLSSRVESIIDSDESIEDLLNELEEYQSDLQDRLDNMPEQLQESSVLNERIDELQSLIDQLPTYD